DVTETVGAAGRDAEAQGLIIPERQAPVRRPEVRCLPEASEARPTAAGRTAVDFRRRLRSLPSEARRAQGRHSTGPGSRRQNESLEQTWRVRLAPRDPIPAPGCSARSFGE